MHQPPTIDTLNIAHRDPWQAKQNRRTVIHVRGSFYWFGVDTASIKGPRT
ncbi:MAG: hypothetical protein U0904_08180 [Candidatus Nanopelagicales bacterium]|nr:hypothetical protein [Candidatus Nanopelagicales bacterium]